MTNEKSVALSIRLDRRDSLPKDIDLGKNDDWFPKEAIGEIVHRDGFGPLSPRRQRNILSGCSRPNRHS